MNYLNQERQSALREMATENSEARIRQLQGQVAALDKIEAIVRPKHNLVEIEQLT